MIGDRELLIVLDNCEHVIATAAEVAERPPASLPAPAPPGDEPRGAAGRWRGHLAGAPARAGRRDDAVRGPSGGRRRPTRASPTSSPRTITEICARLDGLPLAIELAAARTRAFPPDQILSRLNDRFRLLTGGSRTALPRQQTLRAVVDWSYDLLFDDEQRVFARLSVFPGGCDLATAQAVCADDELGAVEVDDLIQALVDKSLVIAAAGGRRRTVHASCRPWPSTAARSWPSAAKPDAVRDAMAACFARLCARSAAAYIGDEQRAWLIAIAQEHDNLRAALEWAVANDDAETALTIAGGASWAHWLAGTAVEAKRWLDDAFACAGSVSDDDASAGPHRPGPDRLPARRRPTGVDADLEAALAVFRRHGDPAPLAFTHSFYAEVAAARGDVDEARRRRRDAAGLLRVVAR